MIAAYCWPQSVEANERIALYCHTQAKSFQIEVIRLGVKEQLVCSASHISGKEQDTDKTIAEHGCRWDPSHEILIDSSWISGFYLIRLVDSDENKAEAFFVVRDREPGDAMLVLATSTWNAYNTWGGLSYYTGGCVVSPMRPFQPGFLLKAEPYRNRIARFKNWQPEDQREYFRADYDPWSMAAGWSNWEKLFVEWAEKQGYKLNYAVSEDLDRFPNLLDGHPAYISVGHDEYWSTGMRDTVEDYIDAGGNAAFFSGNTSFWQVRFCTDYRQMTSYKCQIEEDPAYNSKHAPDLSTMWSDPLVGRPENLMTGVSFSRGGYAHMPNAPDGTGGYSVCQSDHWAFKGVPLSEGEALGARDIVVGYECDGCELKLENGKYVPTFEDGTPEGFKVLATAEARLWETADAPDNLADNYIGELNWVARRIGGADTPEMRKKFAGGHAVMGTFERGKGQVFTSGCTDWAYGLRDSKISKITNNVLARFVKRAQSGT